MAGSRAIRINLRWLLVAAVLAGAPVLPPARAAAVDNRAELIHSLLPAVVNVTVRKDVVSPESSGYAAAAAAGADIKTFVGSGFVIDLSGLIVTNYHVVENAFEIVVTLSDGTTLPGKMLHASRLADLAVVQVHAGRTLTPVQWGDSMGLNIGDPVFAIGNPLGIGTSVSAGIVSGLNRNVQDSPYDHYIQTDAAINHGNSGGPLFGMDGRVVGVNTALVSPTDASAGLGLAIPADAAQFVVDRLMKFGWVRPGWIGIKVQQVTPEMAEAIGMDRAEGSMVSWVRPDGPADRAGLAVGDVVLRYGSDAPPDERALLRDIVRTPVGETVPVAVARRGEQLTVPVAVAEWPRSVWEERDAPLPPERPRADIGPDLGLSLVAIPADARMRLGLQDLAGGVLISAVLPGSDAARRGMADGDVILRVQDKPTGSPADVQQSIDAERAAKHRVLLVLVLQKLRKVPGPSWVTLRLPEPEDSPR
jgi:serine protease Do